MNNLSRTLILLRQGRGLTQSELARQLGVTRTTIGNYESGYRVPRLDMLFKLAEFYGIDMAYLTGTNHTVIDKESLSAELIELINFVSSFTPTQLRKVRDYADFVKVNSQD